MLRKIRIAVSTLFFLLITAFFLDFTGFLPSALHKLAAVQLIPALLAMNTAVLVVIFFATLLFGRIYCSSVCPMGAYQDFINRMAGFLQKKRLFNYWPALTGLRWAITFIVVAAFFAGFSFLVGLLDPYSAFGRITVHLFRPAYLAGNNLLELIFTAFGNHTFYKASIYITSILSLSIALITFLLVGFMAWFDGRMYCNTICPVGTVLGFISRYAFFKIQIDTDACNSCGLCERKCKSSCINSKTHYIDNSRCVNCFNCIDHCNKKAILYRYAMKKDKVTVPESEVDLSKRRFMLALGVTGVAASKLLASGVLPKPILKNVKRKVPIAPPGSKGASRLTGKCTSCHLCVSKCPSHVLKPSFTEYGLGGMMQPMLSFDKGFCNYDCTLCSEVCPNGALLPLTKEQKHQTQLGQVRFILENCIVYRDNTSCGACSEHCPTQAVSMVPYKEGLTLPHTDPTICVGCGGCEYVCPAKPFKAIYVEGLSTHATIALKKEKKEEIKVDDFGF